MQANLDQPAPARSSLGRHLAHALVILAISVPVAFVVPFLFIQLVAYAQDACFDVEAGQGFFLMVTWLEIAFAGMVMFWIGALVTFRLPLVVRLAVGLALVVGIGLIATRQLVPWGPATDYPSATVGECGPGGVPTWWPPILPHH
jgi:hypothetical protein